MECTEFCRLTPVGNAALEVIAFLRIFWPYQQTRFDSKFWLIPLLDFRGTITIRFYKIFIRF